MRNDIHLVDLKSFRKMSRWLLNPFRYSRERVFQSSQKLVQSPCRVCRNVGWEYDERIDVWSVGVTAFMMLTNMIPDNNEDDPACDDAVMFVKEKLQGNNREMERMSPQARSFVHLTLITENKSRPTARTLIAHMWLHEQASH